MTLRAVCRTEAPAIMRQEAVRPPPPGSMLPCAVTASYPSGPLSARSGGCPFEKRRQLCGGFELRNRVDFLERARERIREAPGRSRSEFPRDRREVEIMNTPGEMPWYIQPALDKRPVDHELGSFVREPSSLPALNLLPHRLEIPLHAVDAYCEDVDKAEVLGVFCQDRCEITMKRHVVAHQDPIADSQGEAHGLIVGVPHSDGKAAAFKSGFEIEDAEHFHAVARNCVFLPHHGDLPEAQGFRQSPDNLIVRNWLVGCARRRCRNSLQFLSGNLRTPALSQELRLFHLCSPFRISGSPRKSDVAILAGAYLGFLRRRQEVCV